VAVCMWCGARGTTVNPMPRVSAASVQRRRRRREGVMVIAILSVQCSCRSKPLAYKSHEGTSTLLAATDDARRAKRQVLSLVM
jgi:hypothetical protein